MRATEGLAKLAECAGNKSIERRETVLTTCDELARHMIARFATPKEGNAHRDLPLSRYRRRMESIRRPWVEVYAATNLSTTVRTDTAMARLGPQSSRSRDG